MIFRSLWFLVLVCCHCQEHITVVTRRFRCAEVLFQPKTYELTDGNIFTVGTKRFRRGKVQVHFDMTGFVFQLVSCFGLKLNVHQDLTGVLRRVDG